MIASFVVLAIALVLWGVREDFHRSHLIAGMLWREHTGLAHAFFARSAAHDSMGLVVLSDGSEPVVWGLAFGRGQRVAASAAATAAKVTNSSRRGDDSVIAFYDVPAGGCPAPDEQDRVELVFVRHGEEWRVAGAGAVIC
jgi:hypothetical protein